MARDASGENYPRKVFVVTMWGQSTKPELFTNKKSLWTHLEKKGMLKFDPMDANGCTSYSSFIREMSKRFNAEFWIEKGMLDALDRGQITEFNI